jgi:PhzF family phenazine biosynthesis protein
MQQVAAEMNLSETAFVHATDDGFSLRWFTPEAEVPLCGHATLASAHALWESGMVQGDTIRFHSLSGVLQASRRDGRIEIELPAMELEEHALPEATREALGVSPLWCGRTPSRGLDDRDLLVELESQAAVLATRPDFRELRLQPKAGIIITARSDAPEQDFVSRYFAPWWGIDEDPVTGAAHCALVPFWAHKLHKSDLIGYQASARGGLVHGRIQGDRVLLSGEAVTVLEGRLTLSGADR